MRVFSKEIGLSKSLLRSLLLRWKCSRSFIIRHPVEYAILKKLGDEFMPEDYVDCPELTGKTIQLLRIHRNVGEGTSVQIELTDGTSFTCYVSVRPNVEASLYKGGVGAPETIRSYEI